MERRTPTIQTLVLALVCASSALGIVLISRAAHGENKSKGAAALWLSWSPEARTSYVWGYLHGFEQGKREGCSFQGDKTRAYVRELPAPARSPQAACLDTLPKYPARYFQVYADAVTEYFTKYPNDREAGAPRILEELATPPGLTVDQIHEKLTRQ